MSCLLEFRFIETDPLAFQCLFRCFSVVSTLALTSTITRSENRKNFSQTTTPSRRKIKTSPTARRTSNPEAFLSALFSLVCSNMICAMKADICSCTWKVRALEEKIFNHAILYSFHFPKASPKSSKSFVHIFSTYQKGCFATAFYMWTFIDWCSLSNTILSVRHGGWNLSGFVCCISSIKLPSKPQKLSDQYFGLPSFPIKLRFTAEIPFKQCDRNSLVY